MFVRFSFEMLTESVVDLGVGESGHGPHQV